MRSCRFSTLLAHKPKHTGIGLAKSRTSSGSSCRDGRIVWLSIIGSVRSHFPQARFWIASGWPTNRELSCSLCGYQTQAKQECQLRISFHRGLPPFTVATTWCFRSHGEVYE
jgi:hypothetical protein